MESKQTVLGILAHVDAGKTTLTEALLYQTGAIRQKGRVDHRTTFLDTDAAERARGITVYTKPAEFSFLDRNFTLIDTPGHTDFSPEMERCLQVLDYAILVISSVEGIQAHTETIWHLLKQYNIPVFLFLNKADRAGADIPAVLTQLRRRFHPACIDFSGWGQDFSEECKEEIASLDQEALELYLQGASQTQWENLLKKRIAQRKIFPCFSGSALQDLGTEDLLRGLSQLTSPREYPDDFSARVYQLRHEENGTPLAFLKITGGVLKVKDRQKYVPFQKGSLSQETETLDEKIDQIRRYNGEKWQPLSSAGAGEICAVTGLSQAFPGMTLGQEKGNFSPVLSPVLSAEILLPAGVSIPSALEKLKLLEAEQPELSVHADSRLGSIFLHSMGAVHLEILKETVSRRFGWDIQFGPCRILYKETIAKPVMGYGHYEPLRHYAEVHLRIVPGEPGQGILCRSECSTDLLDKNFQNLILHHITEKEHLGILTGSPLTDVTITLTAGKNHLKHTEGGDFRQATYRAIRQGLEKAQMVLLEPFYSFTIQAPSFALGRILSDLQQRSASFSPPETSGEECCITGEAPAASLMEYPLELTSFTKGKGRISLFPCGYRPCHNPQEVIASIGYEKDRDLENPSSSVFCAHGAGFEVKWQDVDSMRHIH